MHPILFQIGPYKLHSYGLAVFLAFALGIWLGERRARAVGLAPGLVMDLSVWILVSSLLGARLTYVGAHIGEFRGRWLDIISPFQSDGTIGIAGLVLLGGVVAAIPTTAWYLKKRRIPLLKMLDILAPSLSFGIAIGRVGCLLNGCCFGRPTDLPWGMAFPATCAAGYVFPNRFLHPTQVYEIIYAGLIGFILLWRTPKQWFEGELFHWFLLLYGIGRFFNESVRYYSPKLTLEIGGWQVTGSMVLSLVMAATGAVLLWRGFRKVEK